MEGVSRTRRGIIEPNVYGDPRQAIASQGGEWEFIMRRIVMLILVVGVLALSACAGTVLKLDVGTCFDDPETFDQVEDVPIVDCDEPHDNEVIANVELTGGDYPGQDQVENRATQICYDNFSDYVGISYEESIYDIGWLFPTEETWDAGDREVICFAYHLDFAKITGLINGIGQ
ncbi:MAG: septum formation family protein [Actinomycetota bacterium]|nr:septum formation family protein [Actinomycetota bacterium]